MEITLEQMRILIDREDPLEWEWLAPSMTFQKVMAEHGGFRDQIALYEMGNTGFWPRGVRPAYCRN